MLGDVISSALSLRYAHENPPSLRYIYVARA